MRMNTQVIERKEFNLSEESLRDHFAGLAMQAIISNFANDIQRWEMSYYEIAVEAYGQADAMMERREHAK